MLTAASAGLRDHGLGPGLRGNTAGTEPSPAPPAGGHRPRQSSSPAQQPVSVVSAPWVTSSNAAPLLRGGSSAPFSP